MNSIKTKSNKYIKIGHRAIAGVVMVPEGSTSTLFAIYVAWEMEDMAKVGVFGISKYMVISMTDFRKWIPDAADYGHDVTHQEKARRLFPDLWDVKTEKK